MRTPVLLLLAALLSLALPSPAPAQGSMPRMTSVAPDTAKAGETLTAEGENLTKQHVAEVYLTIGNNDVKVQVIEQAATTIKVKVPASIKAGRYELTILTTGKEPKLLTQPVKVNIE